MYPSSRKSTKIVVFVVLKFFIEGGVTTYLSRFLNLKLTPAGWVFLSYNYIFFLMLALKACGQIVKIIAVLVAEILYFLSPQSICFVFPFEFLTLLESIFLLRIVPKSFSSCTITIPLAKFDKFHGDICLFRIKKHCSAQH